MIGTVGIEDDNGNIEYCAVRTVIEERINQDPILVEAEILGKLHAINAKKIGTPSVQTTENGDALTGSVAYTYNVAQFLEEVKTEFDDTFSEDVYQKLGMQRFNNDFSKNLLFQDKSQESIYDIMCENETLRKQNEFLQAEVERLKERLALEKKVTNGNYFDSKQIGTVADLLCKKGNSNIDKVELMKALKDVYSYIAEKSNNIDEDYLKGKLREIAGQIVAEGKPETVTNDYSKLILKTIRNTRVTAVFFDLRALHADCAYGAEWMI